MKVKPVSLPGPAGISMVCFNTNPFKLLQVDGGCASPMRLGSLWGVDVGLTLLGIGSRMMPIPSPHPSTVCRTLHSPELICLLTFPSAGEELGRGDEEGCSLPRWGH